MTELRKKLWQCWFSKLLKKILGNSYEKLTKILRKTYDHNLVILSVDHFEAQTQIKTSFYAKLVWKEKLIKTLPGEADVKLTAACVAIDLVESDGSRQWSHHLHVSGLTGDVGKFARYHLKTCKNYVSLAFLICEITINHFRLCICTT